MSRGYIAIDLGAESGRVIVGSLVNGRIELTEIHRFLHEPVQLPTGLHWDVTGLWREICYGLRLAAEWAKNNQITLVSVGVDTWGVDWALVSTSGELVGLPHAYRDPRNQASFEQVLKDLGPDTIYQTTGIQFMALNSLYSLHSQWTNSKEVFSAAQSLLFMPDVLHYWLSGNQVVEATIASTSQMVDCQSGKWALNLIEPLGLPKEVLGPISPPGTQVGKIRKALASDTGLSEELMVVAPGSHDTASAVVAVPATVGDDWCYLSSGTWSLFGAEIAKPCVNSAAQAAMFTNELGVGDRIRFLKNIAGLWLVQECRRDLARKGQEFDYAELTHHADQSAAFRTLIDPGYAPFQVPGDMLNKICDFARLTDQPAPESPGQFVRCCLESLALAYRRTLDQLQHILDRTFSTLHIIGGGGKNALLNQMAADATGCNVMVGPYEATAIGNTLTQAMAIGDLASVEAIRSVVANSFDLTKFVPSGDPSWPQAFHRYSELVDSKVE